MNNEIEKSPLRALFWKDEILQILYWMQGEGFGEEVSAQQVVNMLHTNIDNLTWHLNKIAKEGFLENKKDLYKLTDMGKKEGGRRFADAFSGLQKAGHGECGPDCEFCYGTDGTKLENCVHNCGSA